MDLRRLREDTRPEHEATEAAMPLMAPGLTLDTYKGVLQALFPILETWERWAALYAPVPLQPLLASRRRSQLLARDLRALGDREDLAASVARTPIDWDRVVGSKDHPGDPGEFAAAFLGAMYVLEGSTLGGRLIARHLEPTLGLVDGQGDAYFRGHGEATGALWRETSEAISAVPEVYAETLIATARRTFTAFRTALENIEPIETSEPVRG